MLFSYQWLKTYVSEIPAPHVLKEELTRRSVEVEAITESFPLLRDIIVAEILSVEKHPNADRLSVCQVNTGKNQIQIVCGGTNVRAGMRVALAPVGATVQWHGEGEPIVLEKAVLRGVESYGMICSTNEIGLAQVFPPHEKEVFDVSGFVCAPGTPLADALDLHDYSIDIDNKSMTHRPDLFSHVGLAREIAAVFDVTFALPIVQPFVESEQKLMVKVEDAYSCRRYRGVELSVSVGRSPMIVRQRLAVCGMKSINNIVDITNYILLEYGQPVHAFDADSVEGGIVVRRAKAGEQIETLDHKIHELTDQVLVIADEKKPLAIAGIIGGVQSAVSEHTTRIILEVAHFDAVVTRKASQLIGVRTDSVLRWEKGPSEELSTYALPDAIHLVQQYAQGAVIRSIDVYPAQRTQQPVIVSVEHVRRMVGIDIPTKELQHMLTQLGCVITETTSSTFTVLPPWFRMDIHIEEDVIEEIVRMYGIHRIPEQRLQGELHTAYIDPEVALMRAIRDHCTTMQFSEIYSYSFYGDVTLREYGIETTPHIEIMNPLSDDLKYLRVSVLPNALNAVVRNSVHEDTMNAYEIGHVYFADREVRQLCMVTTGEDAFRRLRGAVEQLFGALHLSYNARRVVQTQECPFWNWYAHAQALEYSANNGVIGTVGELSSTVASAVKMKGDCAFALISIPQLMHEEAMTQPIRMPSQYPLLPLDLSLVVPESVAWGDIEHVLRVRGGQVLQRIELKDVYTGAPLDAGTKSFHIQLQFQSHDHTLQMNEITEWRTACVAECAEKFGAVLRDNA